MILHTYLSAAFRGAVEGTCSADRQPLVRACVLSAGCTREQVTVCQQFCSRQRDRGLIETARQPLKVFVNSALKCALAKLTPGKIFFWLFENVLVNSPPCPVGGSVTTVLGFCLKLCGRKLCLLISESFIVSKCVAIMRQMPHNCPNAS